MSRIITREEILRELRRRREPVRLPPTRIVPVPSTLLGVWIYVPGEGLIGQYLGHHEYTLDGEQVWDIDYGIYALYARVAERLVVPVAAGVIVPGAEELLRYGAPYEFVHRLGTLRAVPRRRIWNLELVESGREQATILVVDLHELMPEPPTADVVDYLVRTRTRLRVTSRLYAELARAYEDLRVERDRAMAQARAALSLVARWRTTVATLSSVVMELESNMERMAHRLHQLTDRVRRRDVTIEALQGELEEMQATLAAVMERYREVRREVERAAEEVERRGGEVERGAGGAAGGQG
ncbi:MAG: hypothetical protein DRJ67_07340 [Thermoprotei archaeon]|nr:MAG: hypothetical protein DRJ67_07340 [Thermoprotei archaeon]